jgi:hypothetical protein
MAPAEEERRYSIVEDANASKEQLEDHVWFEDRWMVASWCDE